jgi:hypothetical protein
MKYINLILSFMVSVGVSVSQPQPKEAKQEQKKGVQAQKSIAPNPVPFQASLPPIDQTFLNKNNTYFEALKSSRGKEAKIALEGITLTQRGERMSQTPLRKL